MMPARLVPVSSQVLALDATAVSSAPYPHGATVLVASDSRFRLAINDDATDTNSIVVPLSQLVYISVPPGGYISVIAYNPSGGPVVANPYGVILNEVLIS